MDISSDASMLRHSERTLLNPNARPRKSRAGPVAAGLVCVALVAGVLGYQKLASAGADTDLVAASTAAHPPHWSSQPNRDRWEAFKGQYSKRYATPEHESRARANFEARLAHLELQNERNGKPVFGVTEHADREVGAPAFARGRRPRLAKEQRPTPKSIVDIEPVVSKTTRGDAVDWRSDSRGVVSAVKNQGQCGTCWAFSATEQVESQLVLAGAPQVELSTQQVASCTVDPELQCCDGCAGGDPTAAYEYLVSTTKAAGGLAPDAWWPYEQGLTPEDSCTMPECTRSCDRDAKQLPIDYEFVGPYARVLGYGYATPECEEGACDSQDMLELAARVRESPVSVCLNADVFDDYTGGVITEKACGGHGATDVDHCVQLVGFNDTAEEPYWIVRNSWSTSWGESGYVRLEFSPDANPCGLANEATVAVVKEGTGVPV